MMIGSATMKAMAVAMLLVGCSPALATTCWDRETFLGIVGANEAQPVGRGLDYQGNMIEVWVRPDLEFMMVFTSPAMITCLGTYGAAYQEPDPIAYGEKG